MYFPSNMNFQYFFFNTYPGYFLQMFPIALLAGAIYVFWQRKRDKSTPLGKQILASLFVCYITALLCLTLFYYVIGDFYYFLFYHGPSGSNIRWFTLEYDLIPDFFLNFGSENVGNIVLFLPFGVLYPLFRRGTTLGRTVLAGLITSATIELLQPIFGRSFDINDIILNTIGVFASSAVYFSLRAVLRHGRKS